MRFALFLLLLAAGVLAPGAATAKSKYSPEGAKACIDCHETARVMGIMDTAHAEADDPNSPAAQKECQSCHGPSATHIEFPMQVENLHFGKESRAAPEVQNRACLECHENGARDAWHASAHGFEKLVCSTCHNIHDAERIVPTEATVTGGCSAAGCHDSLMDDSSLSDFSHGLGQDLNGTGTLTCAGCHNPHGPLASSRCLDCHSQTPEVLSKQSAKAKRFHDVAERKGTECIRCHKGIAHPIPPLVLQQSLEQMERLLEHP